MRSGIKITKSVSPGGRQNVSSFDIANLVIQIAERCAAESQRVYRQFGVSYLIFLETAHMSGQV